jgi:predicted nucleotidyltransferase
MKWLLESLVEEILRSCDPDEILLFGSHAKGCNRPDSDLDLLVIGDFREAKFLRGRAVEEAVARSPIPVDIHLMTRDEWESSARAPFAFPASVRAHAITLYERKNRLAFLPSRT